MGLWGKYKKMINNHDIGTAMSRDYIMYCLRSSSRKKRLNGTSFNFYTEKLVAAGVLKNLGLSGYIIEQHIEDKLSHDKFLKAADGDSWLPWFMGIYKIE